MTNFKKAFNLILYNNFIKNLFKIDLRLISFFSDNLFGYAFYLFCLIYGFFGCSSNDNNCTIFHSLAAIFVCCLIGLTIQTYALVKIPYTKAYLENLIGKNYIEQYLGKYTVSESLVKIFKYVGPWIALTGAELITAKAEASRQFEAARLTKEMFDDMHNQAGSMPSLEELKEIRKEYAKYIEKASNAKGVISRGFAAANVNVFK